MQSSITRRFIRRVVLAYAVLAAAWIFFSERVLSALTDPGTITRLSTIKGIAFVAITSVLLFIALKSVPIEAKSERANVEGRSRPLFVVFLALTVTLAIIGTLAYRAQYASLKQAELARLQAIAQLKVEDMSRWLNERRANADLMSRSPILVEPLERWIATNSEKEASRLIALLREVRTSFGFSGATLLSVSGDPLFTEGKHPATELMRSSAVEAASSGKPVFIDLHRSADGDAVHMALVAPVLSGGGGQKRILAVAHLEMRAGDYLYPYIENWPLAASSGESVLVKRDGDDVLFLSQARHSPNAAMLLRFPLARQDLAVAQAILHNKTSVEGLDYRDVRVLAAAVPVPGTPWTLFAQVNEDEALAGIDQIAFATGILFLAALAVSIAFVIFLWQRQRLQAALKEVAQGRALQEAENRFRSTFEQAAVGIAHVAEDGRWLRVNQRLCTMLGCSREELLAKTFQDISLPEDLPNDFEMRKQLVAGEIETSKVVKRYLRRDRSPVWVQVTNSLMRDDAGQPDYFISVIEDISDRKAVEEALRQRVNLQEYLGKIADTLPGAICSFRMRPDGTMCIPYASPNFAALTGVQSADVVDDATAAFARIHHEDLGRLNASLVVSARSSEMFETEFRFTHPEKGEIWLEARGAPEADPDGSTLWHGFLYDISERKRGESELRLAMTVFNSSQGGVCVTDAAANVIAVNPAFTSITGYELSELRGKNPRLLKSGRHDGAFYRDMWASLINDGFWQGEVWNRRKNGEIYPELLAISAVRNARGELVNYVATFTDISRIKQSESQLEHLAHHDPLTDLPNRLMLLSSLEHAVARARHSGKRGAALFIDLDRFKNVNESLGHPAGDELLVLVARRLRAHVSDAELLARLGGDEFVLLLDEVPDPETAASMAETLIAQFEEPFELSGGRQVYVGASIGISIFPDDGEDPNALIQHADAALHQAKESGRGTYRFYSEALTRAADERLDMEAQMRRAIERSEFVLHYQPLVSLVDGRIGGVEALLRWQHPTKGLVLPNEFIALAEETGLIVPLGEWVLRTACAQGQEWITTGVVFDTISVNISPRQLWSDIHRRVGAVLEETGFPADMLELEITESALLEQGSEAAVRLNALKELGVRLAIDDFGTGYSSLAYLTRLPIDTLKVDQSFVRNIPDDRPSMEVTAGIIALAKSLNLDVLAEGVETEEQLDFLRRHGCDRAQGYLFSRPLPRGDIAAMLGAFSLPRSRYRRRTNRKNASA